jgi:excisionase family DNA binding protein
MLHHTAAPSLLTVDEVARYLHVHRSTIYRLLKRNQLPPALKIGDRWCFNVEEVDRWRAEQQIRAPRLSTQRLFPEDRK